MCDECDARGAARLRDLLTPEPPRVPSCLPSLRRDSVTFELFGAAQLEPVPPFFRGRERLATWLST
jgi:hypothetical protein